MSGIRRLAQLGPEEMMTEAKNLGAPYELVRLVAASGKLPVPNFAAGGIATPADAALMMQLGAEAVFVGSGIFKSEEPAVRAKAIVRATTHYKDPKIVAEVSRGHPLDFLRLCVENSCGGNPSLVRHLREEERRPVKGEVGGIGRARPRVDVQDHHGSRLGKRGGRQIEVLSVVSAAELDVAGDDHVSEKVARDGTDSADACPSVVVGPDRPTDAAGTRNIRVAVDPVSRRWARIVPVFTPVVETAVAIDAIADIRVSIRTEK
jgi:hypothetical protein